MRFSKYSVEYFNDILNKKGFNSSILQVISIDVDKETVLIQDTVYGKYSVHIKSFCPRSVVPMHKERRRNVRMEKERKKYIGSEIKGLKILDVFYGPDRGYKNRSFFCEYVNTCGHIAINTKAIILKHKSQFFCRSCSQTDHGERCKIDGVLKKRTPTYTHWLRVKEDLPEEYKDYYAFKCAAGDKPYKKASIELVDGKPIWSNLQICEDHEINLMASALRQAFRHSHIYKDALKAASVETEKGTLYLCANCKNLFRRKDIQVDHIDPIMPLNGDPLSKEQLLSRIWTKSVAILDKKCHALKSKVENAFRRANKLKRGLK